MRPALTALSLKRTAPEDCPHRLEHFIGLLFDGLLRIDANLGNVCGPGFA